MAAHVWPAGHLWVAGPYVVGGICAAQPLFRDCCALHGKLPMCGGLEGLLRPAGRFVLAQHTTTWRNHPTGGGIRSQR